jgi:hypothetical protein
MFEHFRKHTPSALSLSFIAFTVTASATTYQWQNANSNPDASLNGWLRAGNYAAGTGNLALTNADELYFNATAVRNVNFNANGTIGTLRFGANTVNATTIPASSNISGTTSTGIVVTLDGTVRPDAGIIFEAGAADISLNARFHLIGNVTLANNSGNSNAINIGGASNGGFQGSGNLSITGGTTALGKGTADNYTNTGTTTVSSNGTLQVGSAAIYTTSAVTIANTGSLSGGGIVGTATILSGGRVSPGGDGGTAAGTGTLSFTSLLALQAGGNTVIDIKTTGVDAIDATAGSIDLGGELRLRVNATYAQSGTYNILLGLDATSGNFDAVTIRTGIDATTAVNLTDDGTGIWSTNYAAQNLELTFNANTGILDIVAVPEPQAAALALIGASLLVRRRRTPGLRDTLLTP